MKPVGHQETCSVYSYTGFSGRASAPSDLQGPGVSLNKFNLIPECLPDGLELATMYGLSS